VLPLDVSKDSLADVAARGRLVILEPDPVLRESIAAVLRNEGFSVELADDRSSLLRIAAGSVPPALVLIDIGSADGPAADVVASLRQAAGWEDVQVGGMTPDRQVAQEMHPELSFVLHRPFTVDELFDRAYEHAVAAIRGAAAGR
jgi:DNA-binding response OmpR family regulator